MKLTELKKLLRREPFRPFTIFLSNGNSYMINEPTDFGSPRNVTHTIIYFGAEDWVLIDVASITEVVNS